MREYLESGTVLSEMMNDVFKESPQMNMETKLKGLSVHLKNLITQSDSFQNIQESKEIKNLFKQLESNISSLNLKISV